MRDNLIDALNRLLKSNGVKKKKLVLQLNSEQHTSFKLFKTFNATVWLVSFKSRTKLLHISKVLRCPAGEEDEVKNLVMQELYEDIINLLITRGWDFIEEKQRDGV